jgi:putative ABC transport system substrate-binding protein
MFGPTKSANCIPCSVIALMLIGCLLTACSAPAPSRVYTIGAVNFTTALDPAWESFKVGMRQLGYVEGTHVRYVYHGAAGTLERLEPAVHALLKAQVDVIVALSTPATQAAQRATAATQLPIVFLPNTNPVASGLVASMRRPGGHTTGVAQGIAEGRRLEWLTEIVPSVKRIYIPYNPDDTAGVLGMEQIKAPAAQLKLQIVSRAVRTADEVLAAFATIPDEVDAVFIIPDSLVVAQMDAMITQTIARRLPLVVPNEERVEQGAFLCYSMRFADAGHQAARLVDQILRGANPGELPVEIPEPSLGINLRTAAALGLTIPDTVLRQASFIVR